MFNGKIHYKWSFSIVMLNYQRVKSFHPSPFLTLRIRRSSWRPRLQEIHRFLQRLDLLGPSRRTLHGRGAGGEAAVLQLLVVLHGCGQPWKMLGKNGGKMKKKLGCFSGAGNRGNSWKIGFNLTNELVFPWLPKRRKKNQTNAISPLLRLCGIYVWEMIFSPIV